MIRTYNQRKTYTIVDQNGKIMDYCRMKDATKNAIAELRKIYPEKTFFVEKIKKSYLSKYDHYGEDK